MFQWPGKFRPAYRRLVPATDAVVLQASPHGSGHPNARGLHAPAKPNRVDGRTSPAMALSPYPGIWLQLSLWASTSMISKADEGERVGLTGAVRPRRGAFPDGVEWPGTPLLKTGASRTPEDTNFLAFVLFLY